MEKKDIVLADGGEEEFAAQAKRLGYDKLILVYKDLNKIKKMTGEGIKVGYGLLVSEKNKGKLIKKINQAKNKGLMVLVRAVDDEFDRFVLEKTRADIIFDLEYVHWKEAMHYRRSGLDQVLCKIAAEKGKTIGISFTSFLGAEKKSRVLGRIRQNLRFCKKYKVKVWFGSLATEPEQMRAAHDLKDFFGVLGKVFK